MLKAIRTLFLMLLCLPFAVHAQESAQTPKETATTPPQVILETNLGDITIELYSEQAPVTVANFLEYVDADFYNETIFHRVIAGFLIQGGGMTADFTRNETQPLIIIVTHISLKLHR